MIDFGHQEGQSSVFGRQARRWKSRGLAGLSVGVVLLLGVAARAQSTPADRFTESLDTFPSIPADARSLIRETWSKCQDCDGEEFLTQALTLASESFRKVLDAYDDDEYAQSANMANQLGRSKNLFVATYAKVYEIKALVAREQILEAGARIADLTADGGSDLENYTYASAEIAFLKGFCLLGALEYGLAAETLDGFLRDYPDAPQRLTISARQMLAELTNLELGEIGEVVDLMGFSRRRLRDADSGESLQEKQQRILDLLDRLVKDAEKAEKSSRKKQQSSGGSGSQNKSKQSQRGAQESQLPGGKMKDGVLRNSPRANPAEMWGAMPPAERERVLQALRDSFPRRYRQLVEQYYEELAKKR